MIIEDWIFKHFQIDVPCDFPSAGGCGRLVITKLFISRGGIPYVSALFERPEHFRGQPTSVRWTRIISRCRRVAESSPSPPMVVPPGPSGTSLHWFPVTVGSIPIPRGRTIPPSTSHRKIRISTLFGY